MNYLVPTLWTKTKLLIQYQLTKNSMMFKLRRKRCHSTQIRWLTILNSQRLMTDLQLMISKITQSVKIKVSGAKHWIRLRKALKPPLISQRRQEKKSVTLQFKSVLKWATLQSKLGTIFSLCKFHFAFQIPKKVKVMRITNTKVIISCNFNVIVFSFHLCWINTASFRFIFRFLLLY